VTSSMGYGPVVGAAVDLLARWSPQITATFVCLLGRKRLPGEGAVCAYPQSHAVLFALLRVLSVAGQLPETIGSKLAFKWAKAQIPAIGCPVMRRRRGCVPLH